MEEIKPEFNSSLQYLWRISNLLWSAHTACMDERTRQDEFSMLEQLQIELDPRMNEQERWQGWLLNKRASNLNKHMITDYFLFLNRIAHDKGLIMKDQDTLPAMLRNTK